MHALHIGTRSINQTAFLFRQLVQDRDIHRLLLATVILPQVFNLERMPRFHAFKLDARGYP